MAAILVGIRGAGLELEHCYKIRSFLARCSIPLYRLTLVSVVNTTLTGNIRVKYYVHVNCVEVLTYLGSLLICGRNVRITYLAVSVMIHAETLEPPAITRAAGRVLWTMTCQSLKAVIGILKASGRYELTIVWLHRSSTGSNALPVRPRPSFFPGSMLCPELIISLNEQVEARCHADREGVGPTSLLCSGLRLIIPTRKIQRK